MRPARRCIRVCAALLLCLAGAAAQTIPGGPEAMSKYELAIWGAASLANGHAFGFAQDRTMYLGEVRYGRRLWDVSVFNFRYVAELIPLALVGSPRTSTSSGRDYVYGAGLSPIGLQMNLCTGARLQPFLASNGGFLYFTDPTPRADATRYNFTVFIASGVQIFASQHRAITLAYKYHHLSNANISQHNPGMDAHMLVFGVSWLH